MNFTSRFKYSCAEHLAYLSDKESRMKIFSLCLKCWLAFLKINFGQLWECYVMITMNYIAKHKKREQRVFTKQIFKHRIRFWFAANLIAVKIRHIRFSFVNAYHHTHKPELSLDYAVVLRLFFRYDTDFSLPRSSVKRFWKFGSETYFHLHIWTMT